MVRVLLADHAAKLVGAGSLFKCDIREVRYAAHDFTTAVF
jgi:hypothetical protein